MRNMMGIILTGSKNYKLKELSDIRSSSAIPVGGKYRAIDFGLSNMVNSGIINVGVITQYTFRSLMDHLGTGKEWDLNRKNAGLFIFPPYLAGENSGWYKGSADALYHNLTYLKRSREEYVAIAQGNCIYKINFNDMLDFHIEKDADITIAYRKMKDLSAEELVHLGAVDVNEEGRIIDFEEKPSQPKRDTCSMGIYIVKRKLLIELLEECISHGKYDFVKDILISKLQHLKIYGFKCDGYWRAFNTINSYYKCNMDMLKPEIQKNLFVDNGNVYTKVKDQPPSKFNEEAEVKNSIVADGCIVEGYVENSVLFRGVTIKKGAIVKDCIVMQGTTVEENAELQYMILDKDVVICNGVKMKGASSLPVVIGKEIVVKEEE